MFVGSVTAPPFSARRWNDARFHAFDEMNVARCGEFEARIDRKLADLQAELTWKVVVLVALIVTVGTALNLLIG